MEDNKNSPAYPYAFEFSDKWGGEAVEEKGLTKRELIAAKALQGILTKCYQKHGHVESEIEEIAKDACIFADALLTQLSTPQP